MDYNKHIMNKFFISFCLFVFLYSIYLMFNYKIYNLKEDYLKEDYLKDLSISFKSNISESSIESKIVECQFFSDLTSYCLYENICMKNKQLYFLTRDKNLQHTSFEFNGNINNWDHYEQIDGSGKPIQFTERNPLPFRSFINGRFEKASIWKESKIFNKGCHAILKFDSENQNIFHWSIKITPLFIYLNFHIKNLCPNFDSIYLLNRRHSDLSDWQKNFLEFSSDVQEERFKFGKNELECFETMFVPGTAIYLFTGPKEAISFREKLGKKLNINFDRFRIVLVKRKDRSILNQKELENFIESKIDKNYLDKVYLENLNFEQQVKLMSQAKLFISVHGAGLTNSIFMPSTSILLEITPPHFHYPLYERVAIQSGHIYFRFVTDPDPSFHSGKYLNTTSRECFTNGNCITFWKDKNIRINITKFSFIFEQILEVL